MKLDEILRFAQDDREFKALVICGPTACGKSYMGHYLTKMHAGEIVNCDSMQIYKEVEIITASPPQNYKCEAPYHLYNFLPADQDFSVIKYIELASEKIRDITSQGKFPIIIGGTGLYISSLLYGYNQIPTISPDIRKYVRNLYEQIGQDEFYKQLTRMDPFVATKLHVKDTQRIIRASEVFEQTGQSIFSFQAQKNIIPLPEFKFKVILLHPERKFLYQMCNERLERIFVEGAIEEIEQLKNNYPNNNTSIMKAVGTQEILSYLNKDISLNEAIILAQNKTRQYAKRQVTWFKNQIKEKITLEYSSKEEFEDKLLSF